MRVERCWILSLFLATLAACGHSFSSSQASDAGSDGSDEGTGVVYGITPEASTPDATAGTASDSGKESGVGDALDGGHAEASANDAADSGNTTVDSGPCSDDLQTDGHNCGSCGHDCLGGPCGAGTCQPVTLASGLAFSLSQAIAVDATSVYWTDKGYGTVMKVALTGGTAVTLASGQNEPAGIAAASGAVYWANQGSGTIMASVAGGPPTTFASGQLHATGVTADSASLYWAGNGTGATNGTVASAPLDGGAYVVLAVSPPYSGFAIKVDSTNVYFTCASPGSLMRVAIDGSTPAAMLATTGGLALDMAIDSVNAYWTTGGGIMEVPLDGGVTVPLASGVAYGIAADPSGVYSTASLPDAGSVSRVSSDGGNPLPLASGLADPTAIAVDSSSIYWINAGAGTVMRLAK
jgi:hypothetical protein